MKPWEESQILGVVTYVLHELATLFKSSNLSSDAQPEHWSIMLKLALHFGDFQVFPTVKGIARDEMH
jgi:hypothetical protein